LECSSGKNENVSRVNGGKEGAEISSTGKEGKIKRVRPSPSRQAKKEDFASAMRKRTNKRKRGRSPAQGRKKRRTNVSHVEAGIEGESLK